MKLSIKHQESYSRGQLLLRTFFGWLYIYLPHGFVLMFVMLWSMLLTFLAFWSILFTGKYPASWYRFQVKMMRWNLRVNARAYNLSDGYPEFGLGASDAHSEFDVPYPEKLSQGLVLLKVFFGFIYVWIPHGFALFFRSIWTCVLMFLAFWAVLFTGKYPAKWHAFNAGTLRWSMRVNLYMMLMIDEYPPFSGKEVAVEAPSPEA